MKNFNRILNIILWVLSIIIAFIVGGSVFNVGFCKGAADAVVGGLPKDTQNTPQRLDNQPESALYVDKDGVLRQEGIATCR